MEGEYGKQAVQFFSENVAKDKANYFAILQIPTFRNFSDVLLASLDFHRPVSLLARPLSVDSSEIPAYNARIHVHSRNCRCAVQRGSILVYLCSGRNNKQRVYTSAYFTSNALT